MFGRKPTQPPEEKKQETGVEQPETFTAAPTPGTPPSPPLEGLAGGPPPAAVPITPEPNLPESPAPEATAQPEPAEVQPVEADVQPVETPVVSTPEPSRPLESLLTAAVDKHASDLMLTPSEPPLVRIDGQWTQLTNEPLDEASVRIYLTQICELASLSEAEIDAGFDAAIESSQNSRYRVNVFQHRGRPAAVLRIIPQSLLPLEQLGLPHQVQTLAGYRQGLVLVTGATGHGKTTTLASLIDLINTSFSRHIITLEDPIEFVHSNKRSVIHQREIGRDTPSFADGLRSALRQSPDVILVGELRDLETITAALTAAETGHLVLGTLHTSGALDTIDRIVDVFPGVQQAQVRTQVASSLTAVISQVLLPEVGGGRALAYEFMLVTNAIRNLIRENKTHQIITAMQTGREAGMVTLERVLAQLYDEDRITYDQAMQVARYRDTFQNMIGKSS